MTWLLGTTHSERSIKLNEARIQTLALMLKVWARICQRNEAGESKVEELFESVGEEFNIGATLVKELHRKVRDAVDND